MAYATVTDLAAALRIRVTAENTPMLQACLDAATLEINHEIDPVYNTVAAANWKFSTTTTAADPGAGFVRFNKTTAAATTQIYLSNTDSGGVVRTPQDFQLGDLLRMLDQVQTTMWEQFEITGAVTVQTGWVTVPVNRVSSSGTLTLTNNKPVTLAATRPSALLTSQIALASRVNILRGVEWFKSADAAAVGGIGFNETGTLPSPRDGFNRHAYTLTPLKQGWGVA